MAKRKWTDEEIMEYRKTHHAIFYCNKEDSNFLVPKLYGIGRTVNFANPITWVFAIIIVIFILYDIFYK